MNINKENYEEYFLLYADKELTPQEQRIVEMFVAANPQLKMEFAEILSTVQMPEEISFANKADLFKKPADEFIDRTNYTERFVAFHDGELSQQEQQYVLDFAASDKALQAEFDLIGQIKMEPEMQVTFPDKEVLYRKERPVVRMVFVRVAAAAILTGAVLWFGFQQFITPGPNDQPVTAHTATTMSPGQQLSESEEPAPAQNNEAQFGSPALTPDTETAARTHEPAVAESKSVEDAGKHKQHDGVLLAASNKETKPAKEHAESAAKLKTEISNAIAVTDLKPLQEIRREASEVLNPDRELRPAEPQPIVTYAAFASNEPDEYVFLDIPAENFKRSKVGVFIKKVKRTIDRNNPINRLLNAEEME